MNALPFISVPQTNRNKTRQINCGYMLARKAPSSRLEIAAPIWRVKTKTPLENEIINERLVNIASWRGKIYSFAGFGDRRLNYGA